MMSWTASVDNSDGVEIYEIHHVDPRSTEEGTELIYRGDFDGETTRLSIGSDGRIAIEDFQWYIKNSNRFI